MKTSLIPREVSLGKVHRGIVGKIIVVSPDSKRVAYVVKRYKWRSVKELFVVDGVEGKEYDGFLRGSKFVFDSPKVFHTLVDQDREIFRVEVEIVEE